MMSGLSQKRQSIVCFYPDKFAVEQLYEQPGYELFREVQTIVATAKKENKPIILETPFDVEF